MQSLSQIKYLGGIGAILVCLGWLPYVGFLLSIAGIVLLVMVFYQLANIANNKDIFNKLLIGTIIGMVGLIVAIIFGLVSGVLAGFGTSGISKIQEMGLGIGIGVGIVIGILTFWILEIIAANFCAKSYKLVGKHFKLDLFNTAGGFLFWGAVTLIVLIGVVLSFISNILLALAFFSLPETLNTEQK